MTEYEIHQSISQLKGEIAGLEGQIAEAEKNIQQLQALQGSCNDYQVQVKGSKDKRVLDKKNFAQISGQTNLVDTYEGVLEDILNGVFYNSAYQHMDAAKAEIEREIEQQRSTISNCRGRIADINSRIDGLKKELENTD